MATWANLLGYQAVWLAAVVGAGRGSAWPGVLAAAAFVVLQLRASRVRRGDLALVVGGLLLGACVESLLAGGGWLHYAAPWPGGGSFAPAWILALWAAFAMTLNHSFRAVLRRPALALVLGAVGGPLAYWGAARGWHAIAFEPPLARGLMAVGIGWASALSALAAIARHPTMRAADDARMPA